MIEFLSVFILQMAFQLIRVLNTKMVVADSIWGVQLTTQATQALWLVTTYLGVVAVRDMNWFLITGFMVGGGLGAWISMMYGRKTNE